MAVCDFSDRISKFRLDSPIAKKIKRDGNTYLKQFFPLLSYIDRVEQCPRAGCSKPSAARERPANDAAMADAEHHHRHHHRTPVSPVAGFLLVGGVIVWAAMRCGETDGGQKEKEKKEKEKKYSRADKRLATEAGKMGSLLDDSSFVDEEGGGGDDDDDEAGHDGGTSNGTTHDTVLSRPGIPENLGARPS